MRAIVLGATGAVGRRVAAELVRMGDVDEVVVAGRNEDAVSHLARTLGGEPAGVRHLTLDVTRADLAGAFSEHDVVACCAGPAYLLEERVLRASIDAGVPYVSLCDDHSATETSLGLDGTARVAGVTAVTGCGISPGITNLLVALAACELDEVEEVDVAVAASSADLSGPASVRHLLFSLSQRAPVVSEHRSFAEGGGGGPTLVYFPEPVEWVETFRIAHPELVTLPRTYESLTTAEFRQGLVERAVMDAARALVALGLVRSESGRQRWTRWTRPLRPLLERIPPRRPDWTAARVDVHGTRGGRSETVSLGVADHISNLASLPMALAAAALGSGTALAPGVHSAEEVFEPHSFLSRLAARGIRVARLEPVPV